MEAPTTTTTLNLAISESAEDVVLTRASSARRLRRDGLRALPDDLVSLMSGIVWSPSLGSVADGLAASANVAARV